MMLWSPLPKYASPPIFHTQEISYSLCFLCVYVLLLLKSRYRNYLIAVKAISIRPDRHPTNSDFDEPHLFTICLVAYNVSDNCDILR